MSVKHILNQVGAKMGLDPQDSAQRSVMLRFLNEAAVELYNQSDMPGSLMEQAFKVNGDQTISLPYYVGQVRAAREIDSQVAWSINQMRPRYNQFNWTDMWRNLRLKNRQCLQATVINESKCVITVPKVENPPIVVTVTGAIENAADVFESVTMDAVQKTTNTSFIDYSSVKKDRVNNYDVVLSDVDGRILTTIQNNQLVAMYQILDVSSCPWLSQSTSTTDHIMEILYKKALPWFENDSDEFPAPDCDNILVNKILQLWFEEQGKGDIAIAYDAKATRTLARLTEDQNRATEDVVALTCNPHDVLLPRIRRGRKKYYRGYGSRGYGY